MKLFLWCVCFVGMLGINPPMLADASNDATLFPHPDRIRYDSQCLTIDNKDMVVYSGAFHYFRCPKPLWRDRFQKIKDAGFNTVETYAAWDWHEQQMPASLDDFSKVDLRDLDDWLNMAEEYGLYVIIRPGPFICAEWDTGGFPQWLLSKRPEKPLRREMWLRSDDPVFLQWCKHWYDAVCPVLAKHQITRKQPGQPGIILFQLENEYDFASVTDDVKRNQVRALAQYARADGIDVPFFTCYTAAIRKQSADPVLSQIFDSCNFYVGWSVNEIAPKIRKLREDQPNAPLMTAELQGGWFSEVGGKLSDQQPGLTASQINNLTLFALQNGESILNYYMLFGGSNPGDWGARNMTTTYDYNAPIREWGGVGDRYQRVWSIAHMIREHGDNLARTELVECDVTKPDDGVTVVMRRARDGSRYLFVRTSQHASSRKGHAEVKEKGGSAPAIAFDYDLEPFGSTVLYLPPGVNDAARGEWLPKPAPTIERPTNLPQSVPINTVLRRDDTGPTQWQPIASGQSLDKVGVFNNGFVFYRAKLADKPSNLLVEIYPGDGVLAQSDGSNLPSEITRKRLVSFSLPDGTTNALLLYENAGHYNVGGGLENVAGIHAIKQTSKTAHIKTQSIGNWRMREVPEAEDKDAMPEVTPGFNDSDWSPVSVDKLDANNLGINRTGVFRATVEISADPTNDLHTQLTLERVDDFGWIYVNGQKVGQTENWDETYAFDVTDKLHPGTNTIAIVVHNNEGGGGVGQVGFMQSPDQDSAPESLEFSEETAGVAGQWWKPDLDDSNWEKSALTNSPVKNPKSPLLVWSRMKFELPAPDKSVWVPWKLHLKANGNGFIYLNGHALGRYWQIGPQYDFFLPECWLNFGKGKTNVVTVSLRPVNDAVTIQEAEVSPYAEFAEQRK